MGMSASQARFLSLTARKTNVEYEGQQINQQRTTLSNESSNYYSQLASMAVPIPPSSADYTKITYTFQDGSANNTVTSLVATKDTAKSGLYMLNYVQEIPSHNMVVSGTSVVTKTNDKYTIGTVELQQAGNDDYSIDKFTKAGIPYEVVASMSEEERLNKLKVEQQYVAMASEKYGNEDWLVRYQKNSSTGSYDAVLYNFKELQNVDYNAKTGASLSGVRQYVYGETTESREIKNAQAKVTQDASGRYQSITIYNDEDISSEVIHYDDTRTEKQKMAAELWASQEPQYRDYVDTYSSPELYTIFSEASASCYNNASHGSTGCFRHVLAHMIDLSINDDGLPDSSAYPKRYSSTISDKNDIVISYESEVYNSAIREAGQTEKMFAVSEAISNGYQPEGKTQKYTIITTPYTKTTTELDKIMSDYYLKQGNANDTQKLLSNYYINSEGEILNKTLKQKCIDIYRAINLYVVGQLEISSYQDILVPVLYSLNDDVQTFNINNEEEYQTALRNWQNNKPLYPEPVSADVEEYTLKGGTTYTLTATTESDDAAYNDAMNQYYYDKAIYDQKIEEVNAKIGIIQVQDKNLELKLKQLDTEQNAIQTEMDAVKKVISKNVESSFKTFNA